MLLRQIFKGRGATYNPANRFASTTSVAIDDGWGQPGSEPVHPVSPKTELFVDKAKSIIARNQSPDVPFEQSINPYKGCEHGCVYCYARPTHAWLDLSPGLDFETKIFHKPNAAQLLEKELSRPGYHPKPITIGANTDPYQPVEQQLGITRQLLEVLQKHRHPVNIITKSHLIVKDLDILSEMARDRLCNVMISVTTLDDDLKRKMEPRTSTPSARLKAISKLSEAGVPVGVLVAPVIPMINDSEIEGILAAVKEAGALTAHYVFLRLPHEVKPLFHDWLDQHFPERAKRVINLIRASHGGKDYNSKFGERMTGSGEYAKMIGQRFKQACRKLELNRTGMPVLDTTRFVSPTPAVKTAPQLALL